MNYTSERLTYREYTEADFDLFYSVFTNEQVMQYAWIDRFDSEEAIGPFFEKVLINNAAVENRRKYEFAVFLSSDNRFIGYADIEVSNQNAMGGCGEIGYFLLPDFWGKGYASEIAHTLMEIGFSHLNLHRISARCNSNNLSSENIMKKMGMVKEGEFRKVRFKNGRWDDEKHYGILVEEWKQKFLVS